jgi:ATP-dependent DNA helicase PIF1
LRNGEITVDDWKLLMTTTPAHITDTSSFDTSLHLFPTAEAVVDFNLYNLHACGQPVATIKAVHSGPNASKVSPDDAGGLDPVVCLCKGARVMLSSNLWVDMGLVNGAMGTVQAICYRDGEAPPNLPVAVTVLFDRYHGPTLHDGTVPIVPICRSWGSSGSQCSRRQLPLKLSWAVTIHKSQGLTLDQVIIDIGNKEFCAGLTFVAISRVRCLSNIILSPPFTFQRLQNISKSRRLNERIMEEQRLQSLENSTLRHLSSTIACNSVEVQEHCPSEYFTNNSIPIDVIQDISGDIPSYELFVSIPLALVNLFETNHHH